MKVIWKYRIQTMGRNAIYLPRGARLLSVGRQRDIGSEFGNSLCLWAEVDNAEKEEVEWQVYVTITGSAALGDGFAGTVTLQDDPPFVVHVYIDKPPIAEVRLQP